MWLIMLRFLVMAGAIMSISDSSHRTHSSFDIVLRNDLPVSSTVTTSMSSTHVRRLSDDDDDDNDDDDGNDNDEYEPYHPATAPTCLSPLWHKGDACMVGSPTLWSRSCLHESDSVYMERRPWATFRCPDDHKCERLPMAPHPHLPGEVLFRIECAPRRGRLGKLRDAVARKWHDRGSRWSDRSHTHNRGKYSSVMPGTYD